jgi:NTP pyrophosphatase (non-canonical NTP hydrolase)
MNDINEIEEFRAVRNWGAIRGLDNSTSQVQYQRFLQEAVEIHEAMVNDDDYEFKDAIGDTMVTLIMLADTQNVKAEDCLKQAFDVIKHRKGINKGGSFVRYMKLTDEEKTLCDEKQGNPGEEYFKTEDLEGLTPPNFEG